MYDATIIHSNVFYRVPTTATIHGPQSQSSINSYIFFDITHYKTTDSTRMRCLAFARPLSKRLLAMMSTSSSPRGVVYSNCLPALIVFVNFLFFFNTISINTVYIMYACPPVYLHSVCTAAYINMEFRFINNENIASRKSLHTYAHTYIHIKYIF